MKKITFTILAISSIFIMSCRQSDQEEIFSPEDQANLEVLKDSSNNLQARKDSTKTNMVLPVYGDPQAPPKK